MPDTPAYKPLLSSPLTAPLSDADVRAIVRYLYADGAEVKVTVDELPDHPRLSIAVDALMTGDHAGVSLVERLIVTLDQTRAQLHALRWKRRNARRPRPKAPVAIPGPTPC